MGLAYLPDGRRMSYEAYLKTPEWKNKKKNRLAFDNWQCAICHADIEGDQYETHHLDYSRLGDEDMKHDIITLCRPCHGLFHTLWEQSKKWESTPYTHWQKDFSLPDTAALCFEYLKDDFIYSGGEYNLCNLDTVRQFIDKYFIDHQITRPVRISEDDVRLFFRNKRYEMYFAAVNEPTFDFEAWLDRNFGKKGMPGGNKYRAEARRFFTKHKIGAMKRIYKENNNINILMQEVERYAETERL